MPAVLLLDTMIMILARHHDRARKGRTHFLRPIIWNLVVIEESDDEPCYLGIARWRNRIRLRPIIAVVQVINELTDCKIEIEIREPLLGFAPLGKIILVVVDLACRGLPPN